MTDGSVTLILGKRGSGKTTKTKNIIATLPRFMVWDWRGEYDYPEMELQDMLTTLRQDRFQVTYRPNYRDDLAEQFDQFAYPILHMTSARNFTLVIDEAYLVCPKGEERSLGKLLRLTRPKNIDLYISSQRPCLIPGVFRSEADRWLIFHLHNPPDLYTIKEIHGQQTMDQVKNLKQFQYIERFT